MPTEELSFRGVFICGWAGGAAGCVVSQPLDTIRVRLQVAQGRGGSGGGPWGALRAPGANQLFAGVFLPTVMVGVWKAIIFCGSSAALDAMGAGREPPLRHVAAGAWFGGLLGILCNTPYEHVKCRAQIESSRGGAAGEGGMSLLRREVSIARQLAAGGGLGAARRLYRGLGANLCLSPQSMALWFTTNEALLRKLRRRRGTSGSVDAGSAPVPFAARLAVGSLSGALSWAVLYPFDVLKTHRQSAPLGRERPTPYRQVATELVRVGGVSALYRGFGATLLRSLPQCGFTMAVYDLTAAWFAKHVQ